MSSQLTLQHPDLVYGIRPNLVERGGDGGVVSTWSQDNRSNDYIQ